MATKANGVDEWVRGPPPPGSFWQRLSNAIYNHEEKSFLGRTPKRWGIVLIFYMVFYAVLAVLFGLCMGGLFLSLDMDRPTYILGESLIGANPGVASRPLVEGSVLKYSTDNGTGYQGYVDQLQEFFEPYTTDAWYQSKTECNADDNFGYPETPCFFIKVNRIIGWEPKFHDAASLPEDMPEDLKKYIQELEPKEQKQMWVSCWDDNANDTLLEYPWGRGLPGMFYPYVNNGRYKSPLVALRVTPPANSVAVIRCRAWATNIIYNKSLKEPSGYTRFQLHVEMPPTTSTEALT